tara:strand:+ start:203 stop:472 length:270 start_codon:yes stop_codon:yes gene_type:complete
VEETIGSLVEVVEHLEHQYLRQPQAVWVVVLVDHMLVEEMVLLVQVLMQMDPQDLKILVPEVVVVAQMMELSLVLVVLVLFSSHTTPDK